MPHVGVGVAFVAVHDPYGTEARLLVGADRCAVSRAGSIVIR